MAQAEILVRGAREHNLRNVTVGIPRGSLTAITGVSGSGKSSLAFDTIHNEGQRRFLESLSSYARQFLGQIEKPAVEQIDGLSPTVSIDQKTVNRNPRSTVGTVTELQDHLRLLFARLGKPNCPDCGEAIRPQTKDQILGQLLESCPDADLLVMAPIVKDRKGEYRKELEDLRLKGYARVRVDGKVRRLDEEIKLARYKRHSIEVVIDRVKAQAEKTSRLSESIEQALKLGKGLLMILVGEEPRSFSTRNACIACGASFPDLEPRLFSFNSPQGACPSCDGLGNLRDVDPDLVIPDEDLSIADGALAPIQGGQFKEYGGISKQSLPSIAAHFGFDLQTPWKKLAKKARQVVLQGSGDEEVEVKTVREGKNWKVRYKHKKAIPGLIPGLRSAWKERGAEHLLSWMADVVCPDCEGGRLKALTRSVLFRGRTIQELSALAVDDLAAFFAGVTLEKREEPVGKPIFKEIESRLQFLAAVGLGYLTIDRSAATLSGGESQRIRLATQVGSRLKGILYVLDEPSIGLHARDNKRLIATLESLRDLGNTVLVVEHDQETMEHADWVIDVGPGAGVHGGSIIHSGSYPALLANRESSTGDYLAGRRSIPMPATRRKPGKEFLRIEGAAHHNLRNIDVDFPAACLTVVTGASGSGKSSLVDDILKRALSAHYHGGTDKPGKHRRIRGLELFDKVIEIDQAPIGRTPRSNPATYTKLFDLIRDLFAQHPDAKARGWTKGRFSFNVAGGRCPACDGAGVKTVSMQFLPDIEVVCDVCSGRRFNDETLLVRYAGKDIHDVLEMTIEEAAAFFAHHKKIVRILDALLAVGLGYVRLGQTATTLSGGEAQRVKLASELRRPDTGRTLYLLDEPTTGLHFQDIEKLIEAIHGLIEKGNTVIVVEHNLDVIKVADWIVDLGPDGGSGGGRLVYSGPFEGLLKHAESHTAEALREFLAGPKKRKKAARRVVADLSGTGEIVVEGARLHNLQGVDVRIPSGSFTVVTGPSGSGKTSLAFDTIFAEGQRRFVESLSAYARQFLGRLEKAPVDRIEGLAPSIAIDQKNATRNPRSTVATTTEIYDYFRLLWARIGRAFCPVCDVEMRAVGPVEAAKSILEERPGAKGRIVAPLFDPAISGAPAADREELAARALDLRARGFLRLLVDGVERRLDEEAIAFDAVGKVDLVIDRVVLSEGSRSRLAEAFEQAYAEGSGLAAFVSADGSTRCFTRGRRCPVHGEEIHELTPRMFSFNHQSGSCPTCHGLGELLRCDPDLLVNRPERPLLMGGMRNKPGDFFSRKSYFRRTLKAVAEVCGFDIGKPWNELDETARSAVMTGIEGKVPFRVRRSRKGASSQFEMNVSWPGLGRYIEKWYAETDSEKWREAITPVMRQDRCESCGGRRLRREALGVRIGGKGIDQVCAMTVVEADEFFGGVQLSAEETAIAERPFKEIRDRLRFLRQVGLEYLSLGRSAATLSGGEAQRIRLATQIGSRLSGVVYVLDEPTIGLHQKDSSRLLDTLAELKSLGNTVIVVEHDEDTIERADWIVDLGPGAGHHGGRVVFQGSRDELYRHGDSLTAAYLTGKTPFPQRDVRREGNGRSLGLRGVRTNNLRNVDVDFPLGCFTCVTGVSGSGKSSLVIGTLVPAVEKSLGRRSEARPQFDKLEGGRWIADLVVIDQSPIGRTPKSNPATYTGCFDDIRALFATAPAAKVKGFKPGRFSFNAPGGRCEACQGRGSIKVEMNFLADVWIVCEVCDGRRFDSDTLTVEWRGKTIADVLDMEVLEAMHFFANHARIHRTLATLVDVGLGYIRLGQSSNTLSGGEAQRIKLASELSRKPQGSVLYVLDEPTTGLHFDDVKKLLLVLDRLVDQGHSVVVIEHNLDVAMAADRIVDLGPEGGSEGGLVVATGSPEAIMKEPQSRTGQVLAEHLARRTGRNGGGKRPRASKRNGKTKGAENGCPT